MPLDFAVGLWAPRFFRLGAQIVYVHVYSMIRPKKEVCLFPVTLP